MNPKMKLNSKIFRAYDIRGRYPEEVNESVTERIILKLPKLLRGKIVLGRDGRLSSPSLYQAARNALRKYKKPEEILEAGEITTPMMYFLINELKAGGGIMITASHNPKEYNGIKISGARAKPVSGQEIEKLL